MITIEQSVESLLDKIEKQGFLPLSTDPTHYSMDFSNGSPATIPLLLLAADEFPKMQVLLSTHESKVANYFHYKYSEAGLKSLPINMKNRRLEFTE